jgi:hypothetical protein
MLRVHSSFARDTYQTCTYIRPCGGADGHFGLAMTAGGACQDIKFGGTDRLEERGCGLVIDGVGRYVLTDRRAVLLTQVITDVEGAVFVLHDHLMVAFPAICDPVQECFSIMGHATRFVSVVFGLIVAQHSWDFLEGLAVHVGKIFVFNDDSPPLTRNFFVRGLLT